MNGFAEKYGASPFDPDCPTDRLAERTRRLLVRSYAESLGAVPDVPRAAEAVLGGMLVGIVQVMQGSLKPGAESDAAIRAAIVQLAPWAVDMARSIQRQPPLSDGN